MSVYWWKYNQLQIAALYIYMSYFKYSINQVSDRIVVIPDHQYKNSDIKGAIYTFWTFTYGLI